MGTELVQNSYKNYTYFENLGLGVIISDATGDIVYCNYMMEAIFGYTSEEMLGNGWWRIFSQRPSDIYDRRTVIVAMTNSHQDLSKHNLKERLMANKNGKSLWTKWTYARLEDGSLLRTVEDISEKKALEEEIERKKRQNTLLRQEVHHRVKNNMQIVISLLNLQFRTVTDNISLSALKKSKERMISIAFVHDFLCKSENLGFSCIDKYLDRLLTYIHENHCKSKKITWNTRFSGHFDDFNNMVSLGLIISELVINAYRHGFSELTQNGMINVELSCEPDGKTVLSVSDNGKGISKALNLTAPETMGYELIISLVHQIEGRLSLSSDNGTKVKVTYYQ